MSEAELLRRIGKLEQDMWVGNGKPGMTERMSTVEAVLKAVPDMNRKLDTLLNEHTKRLGAEQALEKREKIISEAADVRDRKMNMLIALGALIVALLSYLAIRNHGDHAMLQTSTPTIVSQSTTADSR